MADTIHMTTSNGAGIILTRFEELLLPQPLAEKFLHSLNFIKDMKFEEGDVMLCSFPKSGTHWVGNMIKELRRPSRDEPEKPVLDLLEICPPEQIMSSERPRQITTHLVPKRIQQAVNNENVKIVLVLRNPKDVAVSFFYHLKRAVVFSNKQTWNEYFTSLCNGHLPGVSYFDYMDSWEAVLKDTESNCRPSNIEVFYFEEFKQDPLENIRRLNKHLGCNKTDAELTQILEACSIGNLREKTNNLSKEIVSQPLQDESGRSIIFRKGDVGDWKNHFTVAQNQAFEELAAPRLKDSMFHFNYEL